MITNNNRSFEVSNPETCIIVSVDYDKIGEYLSEIIEYAGDNNYISKEEIEDEYYKFSESTSQMVGYIDSSGDWDSYEEECSPNQEALNEIDDLLSIMKENNATMIAFEK